VAASVGCAPAEDAPTDDRPNIVIVLADDMGFGDLGTYGSEIETPVLDRLAAEGIRFSNFHVGASCSPTRTMLMTGVDNHRAGLGNMLEIQADNQFGQPGYEGHLNDRVVTVSTLLRDAGYHTYMVGKWHLGSDAENIPHGRGFERSFALLESGADNWVNMPYAPMYERVHYYEDDREVDLPEDYFSTDYYTEKMIEFIGSNAADDAPFFAFVSYQAVHMPHQAPREYVDKYNGVYDGGWSAIRDARLEAQKELGLVSDQVGVAEQFDKTAVPVWRIPEWESMSAEERAFSARQMQVYAGMVDNMDVNVGRLLDYLEEIGEADNTLVLFLSDNGADPNQLQYTPAYQPWYSANYDKTYAADFGGDLTELGQSGSFSAYGPGWAAAANTPHSYFKTFSAEGGMRVPLIAHFPGRIPSARTTDAFGYVKDVVPTLLEVAGVEIPSGSHGGRDVHTPDGTSMWALLSGEAEAIHAADEVIGYELAGSSAVFQGRYKLVLDPAPKGSGVWELYDLIADPSELMDLSDDMPELVVRLTDAYAAWEAANGVVPVPDDYNPVTQLQRNIELGRTH
jgi:arylsulfatase A-like enzyme